MEFGTLVLVDISNLATWQSPDEKFDLSNYGFKTTMLAREEYLISQGFLQK